MAALTVAANGQVTFRQDILEHLGVHAGDELEVELLPGHRATLQAPIRKCGTLDAFAGCLAGKTPSVMSLEELGQAAEDGWAGRRS